MGFKEKTSLRFDGRVLSGTAELTANDLVFEGDVSLRIPLAELHQVEAQGEWLELRSGRGLMLFEIGKRAGAWADKIKNPRATADKLGLEQTHSIAIVGKLEAAHREEIAASGARIARSGRNASHDVVFVRVKSKRDLDEGVAKADGLIKPTGAIWIVYAKGASDPTEREVLTAGRIRQLTDNKTVALSDEVVSVRFVVPPALRKKRATTT